MTLQLTTNQVWEVVEKESFAVIGMVTPEKEFITYGVGMSVLQMLDPNKARSRAPVNGKSRAIQN